MESIVVTRCGWCKQDPLYTAYHDEEWGVPVRNPQKLFEMLVLESMQAGLSWITVLRKRDAMRQAFMQFSPQHLAQASDSDLTVMLLNPEIIRNRLKIQSVRTNAQAFLRVAERENVMAYFWQFTDGLVKKNQWETLSQIPAVTEESTRMAKQLKKDGFAFLGPTTCYAFMQAVGMVNDHITGCFRWSAC
ncbi:DNA-3-methyladenine glycosylase I [Legionella sp. MW5194]|nr:DNA-3-methyladenine glycosylase I [Legionella sp. MW5194]